MNDQTSQPEKAEPQVSALPEKPHTEQSQTENQARQSNNEAAGIFAGIGLTHLILVLLTAVFAWQWLDGHRAISDMERQLAEKIADMSANSKANQMLMSQSQEQVRELAAKVTMMETRFGEARNQRAALEALYNDLSGSRDETALAEVEQMLLTATQQLQLTANVKAALIAMQSGDARLQRMDRLTFNGLRNRIGKDMDKLRALPSLDITGLNLKLDNLIAEVDALPLVYQHRVTGESARQVAAPANEAGWKMLLTGLWNEMKQLVRIENTGNDEIPLLSPDQEFFLRENLKLRLLAARLALLSRDETGFRQELKTAQRWTAKYFDNQSEQSVRMQSALKKLAESTINIELPDISGSLQAVRDYRQAHENAAERSFYKKGVQ